MKVMVNGLPGKMATEVARLIHETDGFELIPLSLTGPEIDVQVFRLPGSGKPILLVKPDKRDEMIADIKRERGQFIAVDFTHPDAANGNVEFYCKNNMPFVMGTTGGDRDAMLATVLNSRTLAVIAPNMAPQIVAFQAMMEDAAINFPGAFEGFNLFISESHQDGKADTSGTAKAVAKSFVWLGIPFDFGNAEQFEMIRSPARQTMLGVPQEHIKGHGWHKYSLFTPDGTMFFEFVHNVNGRKPYAMGTLKALTFLEKKVKAGEKGVVYSMIDVLKG
jgi:4-hydroxy-tetrahydrodipicolinate reductase